MAAAAFIGASLTVSYSASAACNAPVSDSVSPAANVFFIAVILALTSEAAFSGRLPVSASIFCSIDTSRASPRRSLSNMVKEGAALPHGLS